MKSRLPTSHQIQELVAFLPRLYADRELPENTGAVEEFFQVASRKCWDDREYQPEEADRMLQDQDAVKSASLSQIKTMLTYCVRWERFCDGFQAAKIEDGSIRRLLERLAELGAATTHPKSSG